MKIHHLNCATLCPFTGTELVKKLPLLTQWSTLVCHCLLVELDDYLVLIDTGLGIRDVEKQDRFWSNLFFNNFAKPKLDLNETAYYQIKKLGFDPKDVKHIILTHLDSDHAGGISDFPWAEVHVLEDEYQACFHQKDLKNFTRYHQELFIHAPKWHRYQVAGEKWRGFEAVRNLNGIDNRLLIVPLVGHTKGHCGVAIEGASSDLMLFAGDAYLNRKQIQGKIPPVYVMLYNKMMHENIEAFENNIDKLSEAYEQQKEITIFCSHDRHEFNCLCSGKKLT